jgi:hypothetical protein
MMQVTKVWWDGEKLMAEPIDPTTIYQEPLQRESDFWEGYQPEPTKPAPVREDWGPGPHEVHSLPPAAPVQEPVAWKWHQAPVKTQWGDDMVVADISIDKDHTVSVYCERDQTAKVEAIFIPPAAPDLQAELDATNRQVEILSDALAESRRQRQWVGLSDEEMQALWDRYAHMEMMRAIEAKLKEKNT